MDKSDLDWPALRARVRQAERIAVFTGAGMSAESGVATFRDAQTGLWARYRPEDLATPGAFRSQPQMVWDWYAMRRAQLQKVAPNAGHRAVAEFQRRHPGRLSVITQNTDGLHERAGSPDVLTLHGRMMADHWLDECPKTRQGEAACAVESAKDGRPPFCEACGNFLRPSVVWFGESLPGDTLARAEHEAQHCDLMLVVGTTGAVWPAAGLVHTARAHGAHVLIINTAASELDRIAHTLVRGASAQCLPQLLTPD